MSLRPVFTERPWNFDALVEQEKALIRAHGCVEFLDERGLKQRISASSRPQGKPLLTCKACGEQKARASDGFCSGCGNRPTEAEHYVSYQVMR